MQAAKANKKGKETTTGRLRDKDGLEGGSEEQTQGGSAQRLAAAKAIRPPAPPQQPPAPPQQQPIPSAQQQPPAPPLAQLPIPLLPQATQPPAPLYQPAPAPPAPFPAPPQVMAQPPQQVGQAAEALGGQDVIMGPAAGDADANPGGNMAVDLPENPHLQTTIMHPLTTVPPRPSKGYSGGPFPRIVISSEDLLKSIHAEILDNILREPEEFLLLLPYGTGRKLHSEYQNMGEEIWKYINEF
ncbi:hypothetical protein BDN71DRAFT_1509443 [Pleurotus eryngii]|uniref:Uncharacterized protein n=1 Tax=Pleurotus eryngii TaxID=5323 RepID=A0A9P6DD49_PLEER|nr:hypothetical protein BDN71DRAFT_1509443 [Pleurotus eryngii]